MAFTISTDRHRQLGTLRGKRSRWRRVAAMRWGIGINRVPDHARWAAALSCAVVMVHCWGWDRVPKGDLV